jgi:hypothetical protein
LTLHGKKKSTQQEEVVQKFIKGLSESKKYKLAQILNNQRVHASTTNPDQHQEVTLANKQDTSSGGGGGQYRFTIDAFDDQIHYTKVNTQASPQILPPDISRRALDEEGSKLQKSLQLYDLNNKNTLKSFIQVKDQGSTATIKTLKPTLDNLKPNTILGICENPIVQEEIKNPFNRQETVLKSSKRQALLEAALALDKLRRNTIPVYSGGLDL